MSDLSCVIFCCCSELTREGSRDDIKCMLDSRSGDNRLVSAGGTEGDRVGVIERFVFLEAVTTLGGEGVRILGGSDDEDSGISAIPSGDGTR